MSPREFMRRNLEKDCISYGVKKTDAYRVVDPIMVKFDRGDYRKLNELFDKNKKDSKQLAKSYKK